MRKATSGFTIVELLIVIIVIGILASITVVAYRGVNQRGRDVVRKSDFDNLKDALDVYRTDNGGYPNCSGGYYVAGTAGVANTASICLGSVLVPGYLPKMLTDPINTTTSGTYVYMYAAGYKKTGATTYVYDQSDNYIIGVRLETGGTTYSGWGYGDLTLLDGSSN